MNFIDGFWIPRLPSLIFNFTGYSNLQLKLKLRINIGDQGTSFRIKLVELLSLYTNIISRGKFRTQIKMG